jgi:AhpD family alkylhydroperoxidase
MKSFVKGLDNETQLLVAVGASVAAGCIPCLESIVKLAEAEGIDPKKMKSAAIVGQFVKDQPAAHMKAAADRLLGTHLQAGQSAAGCPAESGESTVVSEGGQQRGCGCQ